MLYGALAVAAAALHLAFVIVLVGGAAAVCRHPAWWKLHAPAALAMTVVTLAGADCPLTVLENQLRARAGWSTYESGFISHYLVEPWHPAGIDVPIRLGIIAIWLVPNVVAYTIVVRWRLRHATPTAVST